jgi:hypothetical protein
MGGMELEITPEPSEEERAAIAAALAREPEDSGSRWDAALLPPDDEPA